MKNLKHLAIIVTALVVFFNGCKKDDHEATVFLCPLVVSTISGDEAIDVPLNQIISATFNEKMDPATINQESFIIQQGGTSIAGTVAYSELTATFTPSVPLLPNVLYSGTIKTQAKDIIGQALKEDYKWSFTTIAEVTLSSNPTVGGTVSGNGSFDKGSSVNVTATPNEGYSFINWTLNDTPVSTDSSYQFTMDGNNALVANFTLQLIVGLSSSPSEGGTTTGGGAYDAGQSVTVSATAIEGYSFLNWTEGTNIVSEDANYTYTITGSRELVANFTKNDLMRFTVELVSSPAEGGTITGEGSYVTDTTVTVSATANEGYSFTNWTEGANVVSEEADYTFTITGNQELVANFTENNALQLAVQLSANPSEGGTITGDGNYELNESVTISANANEGYSFTNWTEGTDVVSEDSIYTFTITDNRELVANFTGNIAGQFTVDLLSSPAEGGTTTGDGNYDLDESVTVSANPNEGYSFMNWTEGTDVVSEDANYTFTITDNKELVANFTEELVNLDGINLGSAGNFAVLAGSGVSNIGVSTFIIGDVGSFPTGTINGLLAGNVDGILYTTADPLVGTAKNDLTEAYNDAQSRSLNAISLPGQLGGLTLAPGLYVNSSTSGISGTGANGILTLDAGGDANAVWIFKIGSTLVTDAGTSIVLAGGAQAKNIYWSVGTSATLGTNSSFYGNILADQSITLTTGATLIGRALTRIAGVTLDSNAITKP